MLTPGILLLLMMLLTPGRLMGLARQAALSSSSRKKKPPSLHGTECGQHRDSGGLPEPRTEPDMAVRCRPARSAVALGVPSLSHPYVKLIPGGNITPRRHFEPQLFPSPFVFFKNSLINYFFSLFCPVLLADTG